MVAPALGYRPDVEDRIALRSEAVPLRFTSAFRAPEEIDHSKWRKNHIEQQGGIGSCVGHGSSSGCEVLNYIATRGQEVHLNRMFAYVESQRAAGLVGQDSGATINGASIALKNVGICREQLWPYTGKYSVSVPDECYTEARNHRVRNHVVLRSYEEDLNWLASGVGVIVIGIPWYAAFADTRDGMLDHTGGELYGYHCIVWWGYKRVEPGKPHWLLGENSHGVEWGNRGMFGMSSGLVKQLHRDPNSEFVGFTDLSTFTPRSFDFMKMRLI